ncbi:hypothetical protein QVD17_09313 [Tagetes erecta]|uniref:F-box associated beta-propeller type 1 domain-containing protein n=1 Tax=Tagetes erecta TaxID=13708 RepID=A0AAD8L5S0_TARER|nr:hypothetical protein QVD17_09313 [Tagetes erecta]
MAVLWNFSIRKVVAIVLPNMGYGRYSTILGFGVCRETSDPKIVKIRQICRSSDIESITCIPWQVEVFTLSAGTWRSPYNNLPRKSIEFSYSHVGLDGFIYWLAVDRIVMDYDDESMSYNLIISFDLTNEEFRDVNLPDNLAHESYLNLYMSKLSESLVVLESTLEADNPTFTIWIMENGVSKSFTKLFTIYNVPHGGVVSVLEFRKCGEPVIEVIEEEYGGSDEPVLESEIVEHHRGTSCYSSLIVYKPYSKHMNNIGINGITRSFEGYSYKETLLLLDQPDYSIYDNGKCYNSNVRV